MSVVAFESPKKLSTYISERPYRRAETLKNLRCLWHLPASWQADPLQLQAEFGVKKSLKIAIECRRAIKLVLEANRRVGRRSGWYYDMNLHLNLAAALRAETRFAYSLLEAYEAAGPAKPKRTAAHEFGAIRADIAELVMGEVA